MNKIVKVYCEDCTHCCFSEYGEWCFPKKETYDTPIRKKLWKGQDPWKANVTNNCQDYKRKWWKFWIK